MSQNFATGKNAKGICDRCGLTFKLKALKDLYVKDAKTGLKVCGECFEPSHPQLRVGEVRIDDPQALREPRPDSGKQASTELVGFDGQPASPQTGVPFQFPKWG